MEHSSPGSDAALLDLLVRWQEAREMGQALDADQMTDDPRMVAALERAIAEFSGVEADLWGESITAFDARGVEGRYRIDRVIGSGGMADVYAATDLETGGREVAYKLMRRGIFGAAGLVSQFYREPTITDRLRHPGIPPIYAIITDQVGRPAYAMELLTGVTLEQALVGTKGHPPISVVTLLKRLADACRIADFAHQLGYVHCDISPRNLMLLAAGEAVRVVDWGSACQLGSTDGFQSPGTPGFRDDQGDPLAPPTPALDIFSLGRCLALIVESAEPTELAKLKGRFRSNPSRALEAIVAKATATPARRYTTAGDLAADIDRFLADEVVSAYPEPLGDRCLRWISRHRGAVVTGGLVAMLALAVVLALSARNRELRVNEEKLREQAAWYEVGAAITRARTYYLASNRWRPGSNSWVPTQADESNLVRALGSLRDQDPRHVDSVTRALETFAKESPKVWAEQEAEQWKQAKVSVDQAIHTLRLMLRDFPTRAPVYRPHLANLYNSKAMMSVLEFNAGDIARITARYFVNPKGFRIEEKDAAKLAEVLSLSVLALELLPRDVDANSNPDMVRKARSDAWMVRIIALMISGRFSQALVAVDRAQPLMIEPEQSSYRLMAPLVQKAAEVEQQTLPWSTPPNLDHRHAVEMAEYLAQRPGTSTGAIFNAACTLALASQDDAASQRERTRRADRAMVHLTRLADQGYFRSSPLARLNLPIPGLPTSVFKDTLKELREDQTLDPLRRRDDFRKLQERLTPR